MIHRMSIPRDISCISKETDLSTCRRVSLMWGGRVRSTLPFPSPLYVRDWIVSYVRLKRNPGRETVFSITSSFLSLVFIHAKDKVVC